MDRPHHGRVEAQPPPSAAEDSLTSAQEQSWGPASKAQQVVAHGETQRALILTTPDKTKVRILFEPGPPLPPPKQRSSTERIFSLGEKHPPVPFNIDRGGEGGKAFPFLLFTKTFLKFSQATRRKPRRSNDFRRQKILDPACSNVE